MGRPPPLIRAMPARKRFFSTDVFLNNHMLMPFSTLVLDQVNLESRIRDHLFGLTFLKIWRPGIPHNCHFLYATTFFRPVKVRQKSA